MTPPEAPRTNPLLAGLAMLGLGLLLRQWQPTVLTLPKREVSDDGDRGLPRVARKARDGVVRVMPGNVTGAIGRSLLIAGAALIAIRALDLLVEDDDALF